MSHLNEILDQLSCVEKIGRGFRARCPAHNDDNPSLSVAEGDNGKVLLHCYAGCSYEEVRKAMRHQNGHERNESRNGHRRILETYDYLDAEGRLRFQVVRWEPKEFRQRRPDGEGGWVWNLKGVEPILYRLPEILQAVENHRPVYVCEGERDVHRLEREGLTATTNPMGAGKWRDHFSYTLAGADVRILPDNDGPGRKHARKVAEGLRGKARDVQIVELPGLGAGEDVSDWFDSGGTAEELQRLPSSSSLPHKDSDDDGDGATPVRSLRLTSLASIPRPPNERPMIVEGMFPQRFPAILYGDGGTAKSLLAASLLMDVSRGAESWMGHQIRQHGPVIYLDFELDLEEQSRRVYQLAEGAGLDKPPEAFYYLSGADHPAGSVLKRTLELATECEAVVVLLDSLGFALEGDAEASRDVLRFVREHIKPFERAGITLLIVDHQAKLTGSEGYHQKSPFGSVYKSNACRSVLQVGVEDQQEGELIVRFRHMKANFGSKFAPFEAHLLFDKTKVEIRHRALDTKDLATEGSLNTAQKIRRLLKNGPMFPNELAEKIEVKERSVKNTLTRLRKSGEVENTGTTSDSGAQQVQLVQPPSSPSQPYRENDDDDGRRDGARPEVLTRTPAGTLPLYANEWEEV